MNLMDRLKLSLFPPQLHSYEGSMFPNQQINCSQKSGSCFGVANGKRFVYLEIFCFLLLSWQHISVFEIMGKFQSHGKNRAQCLHCLILWQILTYNMQYFWIAVCVYVIRQNCHQLYKFRILYECARMVWKFNVSKNDIFAPTLKMWQP